MAKIIVDIGINHMGDMNIARKLISDAAECGADVAKFQWYDCDDLFGDPSKDTYNKEIYDKVKPFELSEQKIKQLWEWCDIEGIEFMCSIFDHDRFDLLESMGVAEHKIASRVSKYDRGLAERILNTGKTCYASLGFDAEPFDKIKYPNVKHLFCVAKYPSWTEDFVEMPKIFNEESYYGFSSHATNHYPAMVALSRGAQVIEVHFTLNKSMSALSGGFDHLCSLDKSELDDLINFAYNIEMLIEG